ncbi:MULTISPECIES: peptide deformylase [Niastella]|uniref:Peptide deformylase n=1 Tax=Niastella soli TaxID=2821487 RepID=A0ABS3YUL5_9BACT|nr:peptide deformylase [Niastella soli]MBO9201100.1 peptide deformylase [Niastella soli]
MILPIVAYGADILRSKGKEITPDYPNLAKLIEDMWETMYASSGVGLAAPQINKDIRLFIIDSAQIFENQEEDEKGKYPDEPGVKQVFINAQIKALDGEEWAYNEGCLSIPRIREDVMRNESVTLTYVDENFVAQEKTFNGLTARIILHEYDHIEGKLFIDYLKPFKRKLLRGKLDDISKGKVRADYKMIFPK